VNSPKDRVDPVLISSEVLLWASPPPPEPLRRPPSATSPRTGRDHERLAATISTSSAVSPYSRYTIASMSRSTSPIRNKSGASFSTDAKYSRRRSSPKARRFGSTRASPSPRRRRSSSGTEKEIRRTKKEVGAQVGVIWLLQKLFTIFAPSYLHDGVRWGRDEMAAPRSPQK